ncbi:MAG: 6-phosphogluconolactonase [Anaerolineae bacterium]|nr:6-phosphogluconolactonase [Anaerolineae bacterium]
MIDDELVIVPDAEALAREAARRLANLACEAAESRGRFGVALSGGSTHGALYRLLAEEPYLSQIPWAQVHLFWADERCVPPNDPGSNYRLARENLIAHVPIPPENVHRVRGELAPKAAARAYDRELKRFFREPRPRFGLVLLGLGSDGHTASLFPNSEAIEETERLAVATTALYDNRPTERVTLTLPALNAAQRVLFLVSGLEKAEIMQAVLTDVEGHLPARRVRPVAGQITWLVDAAAATRSSVLPHGPAAAAQKRM